MCRKTAGGGLGQKRKTQKMRTNFYRTGSSDVLRTADIFFNFSLSKRSGHNRKEKGESKFWVASGFWLICRFYNILILEGIDLR